MLDFNELEKELSKMTPRSRLFKLIKQEMIKRDRWKVSKRGKPFKSIDERRFTL